MLPDRCCPAAARRGGVTDCGLEKGYTSLEELVADPEVDVVHICTPNYLHFEMAKAALENGKHVICDAIQRSAQEGRWVTVA